MKKRLLPCKYLRKVDPGDMRCLMVLDSSTPISKHVSDENKGFRISGIVFFFISRGFLKMDAVKNILRFLLLFLKTNKVTVWPPLLMNNSFMLAEVRTEKRSF